MSVRKRNKFSNFSEETNCEHCVYGTHKRSNYHRHLSSRRHISNFALGSGFLADHQDSDSESESGHFQEHVYCSSSAAVNGHDSQDGYLIDLEGNQPDSENILDNNERNDNEEEDASNSIFPDDEAESIQKNEIPSHAEWFPFESKTHFLLTVLYSSKTHRISDEVMSYIIFIMKECGVKDVPPMSKLKNFLQRKTNMEDMIQKHEDKDGNIAYTISPSSIIRLQMANPGIAEKISRYYTVEPGLKKNCQTSGEKWKEIPFYWATNKSNTQFFKDSFVTFVVRGQRVVGKIRRFLEHVEDKKMYAKVDLYMDREHTSLTEYHLEEDCLVKLNKGFTIGLDECEVFDIKSITSMKEVINSEIVDVSDEAREEHLQEMMPPLYKGLPIFTVPVNIFLDDLSANQSKRWSPLHAVQCQLAGLPLHEKSKGKNVFFLGLSDRMTMTDLMQPICKDIENSQKFGVETYDAFLKQKVTINTEISLLVTDFQMMSLACNHLGPSANKFCPKCFADDSNPFVKFDERNRENTCRTLERLKIVKDKASLQTQTGVKLFENCLWQYIDPHRETPIGILHFLYLGLAKQLIKFCLQTLTEHQKNLLEKHLESIDQSGFSYHVNSSMFEYIDSRQGKDYKHYLQVAVINMEYAGLERKYLRILEKLALISKHMVLEKDVSVISREMTEYMTMIEETIPSLGRKRKTHLGVHLEDDMLRHGHPLHYTEDAFEKNHKAIRSSIAYQNKHARSRDTAIQFVNNELMGHVVSGGFMQHNEEWKQASKNVIDLATKKKIKDYLGMPEDDEKEMKGTLKAVIQKQLCDEDFRMLEVQILQAIINLGGSHHLINDRTKLQVQECKTARTGLGENSKVGSFVLYNDEDSHEKIGKINRLLRLRWKSNIHDVVVIEKVKLLPERNDMFQRLEPESTLDVLNINCIKQLVHVVHDCKRANCCFKDGITRKKVEQEWKDVKSRFIKHSANNSIYILNNFRLTHSFDKFLL